MDRLIPERTCLLVVDVQERLAAAMPEAALAKVVTNTCILLEAAELLGVRVLASEQYPKGLGPTVPAIAERLAKAHVTPVDKLTFDAASEPRLARALAEAAPRAVVVVGMEAHVCVFQTARELVRRGYATYVVEDAVSSRTEENKKAGLRLAGRAGAVRTVTEAVVFDWLERAGSDAFKTISRLVK